MTEHSVVGVIVAAGDAYLATATVGKGEASVSISKLQPAKQMPTARALADLGARIAQELRRLEPTKVVIVEPKPRQQGWSYSDAFKKASVETMVMTAAAGVGVQVELVKPSKVVKDLGLTKDDPDQDLKVRLATVPKYWSTAWLAAAAALVNGGSA